MTMITNVDAAKAIIDSQAAKGLRKYLVPLEQSDLTVSELANMGGQEVADALCYFVALETKAKQLEADVAKLAALFHQCVDDGLMTAGHVSDPETLALIRKHQTSHSDPKD